MPSVRIRFSPLPAHVRTARLVAVAVARRAGVPESALDELRLAVGEACSRAVSLHQMHTTSEPVELVLSDEHGHFTIEVLDRGPATGGPADLGALDIGELAQPTAAATARENRELLPAGFGLAVIAGLVDDFDVDAEPQGGTRVRMSWPVDTLPSGVVPNEARSRA